MNLKFLETFVWVARLKSFRLTAEKLFSTQAAISSRIAVLEGDLGVKLFVRDSRGVTLTPEGHQVLEYAERMLDTAQSLRQAIDAGRVGQGRIRIGAMDTVIHTWLSPLVARGMERFPDLEIELMADTAINLAEQLRKGYLDLIFQTDAIRHESVLNLELGSYPLRWVVPRGSPYDRDYTGLEDLFRERVLTFSKHSRPHLDLLTMLQARDVSLTLQRPQQSSILNLLPATVTELAPTDTPAHLLVRLDVGGNPLLARITRYSCEQLGLRVGEGVWAQVKSVAVLA